MFDVHVNLFYFDLKFYFYEICDHNICYWKKHLQACIIQIIINHDFEDVFEMIILRHFIKSTRTVFFFKFRCWSKLRLICWSNFDKLHWLLGCIVLEILLLIFWESKLKKNYLYFIITFKSIYIIWFHFNHALSYGISLTMTQLN